MPVNWCTFEYCGPHRLLTIITCTQTFASTMLDICFVIILLVYHMASSVKQEFLMETDVNVAGRPLPFVSPGEFFSIYYYYFISMVSKSCSGVVVCMLACQDNDHGLIPFSDKNIFSNNYSLGVGPSW